MTLFPPDHRHRLLIPGAVGAAVALMVTGCSSGSKGATGSSATTTSTAASTSAATTAASTPGTSSAATSSVASSTSNPGDSAASGHLAEQLAAGVSGVTSLHLSGLINGSSTASAAGTISADEKLSNGKVTAIDLTEKISGQSIRLILIGTKAWAKLPTSTGSKPWLKVTSSSTNPTIRAVAASLSRTSSQTSLDGLVSFAKAASNIAKVGSATVDGVSTTHYTMTVITAKLPSASGKALVALGVKSVPTQMWIDGHGRPVRVSEKVTAGAVSSTTTLNLIKYNQPVSVTPPPAAQIGG